MIKRRRKKNWFAQIILSVLGALIVGYFIYHTIQGDRGMFVMFKMNSEIAAADSTLHKLQNERRELEHRTKMLQSNNIDPDLLDEKSRELLNYSKPNEIIILTPDSELPK